MTPPIDGEVLIRILDGLIEIHEQQISLCKDNPDRSIKLAQNEGSVEAAKYIKDLVLSHACDVRFEF